MDKHPYQVLPLDNGSKIILTPCPGTKGTGLAESIVDLAQEGAKIILTLMFDEEMIENNIQLIPELCKQEGITWLQLPIVDDDVPKEAFENQWQQRYSLLLETLKSGGGIAIHCKGGTGRTGLVAAMLLTHFGYSYEKTIKLIQNVRPKALRNDAQLAYFKSFTERLCQ